MKNKFVKIVTIVVLMLIVLVIGICLYFKYNTSAITNLSQSNNFSLGKPTDNEFISNENRIIEDFEIHFYNEHPDWEEKKHIILAQSETDKYDYDIYAYDGIVNIIINGKEMSLRDALLKNKITVERIIEKAHNDSLYTEYYQDGGSQEFRCDNYTIIKCNINLNGKEFNRDIYIGKKSMTLSDL